MCEADHTNLFETQTLRQTDSTAACCAAYDFLKEESLLLLPTSSPRKATKRHLN